VGKSIHYNMLGESHGALRFELMISRTLYYDSKTYKPDTSLASRDGQAYLGDYEKGLLTVGRFETVRLLRFNTPDRSAVMSGIDVSGSRSRGSRGI
jgi:hypothetical protein